MPQGIFVPPRSVVEAKLPAWLEMATYTVQLDTITSTFSTGEYIMEYFPPDSITLLGIGYRLVTPFSFNDAANVGYASFPEIWFGDTTEHKLFGVLSLAELISTDWFGSGFLPIFYQDTSSDGMTLTATIHNENQAAFSSDGELELWMQYRVRSGRSANRGSNVV